MKKCITALQNHKKVVSGVAILLVLSVLTIGALSYYTDYAQREIIAQGGVALELSIDNGGAASGVLSVSQTLADSAPAGSPCVKDRRVENKYWYAKNTPVTITASIADGYTFLGWFDGASQISSSLAFEYTVNGGVSFSAKAEPTAFAITYNTNGGDLPASAEHAFTVESPVTLPTPTRDGYRFMGWYESDTFSGEAVTSTAGYLEPKTFYAKWDAVDYTITYNSNGGEMPENPVGSYTIEDTVALPEPARTGYSFEGWAEDADNDGIPDSATGIKELAAGAMGDKSFVAVWAIVEYSITLELDGGAFDSTVFVPEKYTVLDSFTLPEPTKDGYIFTGWSGSNGTTPQLTVFVPVGSTGNVSYTANWLVDNPPVLTVTTPVGNSSSNPSFISSSSVTVSGTATDDVEIASLKVNGKAVPVNNNGAWTVSIDVPRGVLTGITAILTDSTGNTVSTTRYVHVGPMAQALYTSSDDSLIFVKQNKVYVPGDTYDNKTVTAVYTGFEKAHYYSSSSVPWYGIRDSIKTVTVADTIEPSSIAYWFSDMKNCAVFIVGNIDASSCSSFACTFANAGVSSSVTSFSIVGLSEWNTSAVTNMNKMFYFTGYHAASWEIGDLSNWDTSSVTNMNSMFDYAGYSATSWSIGDLSDWDTSSVTDMGHLFGYAGESATSWSIGDLSDWDTSSVTNMNCMIYHAGNSATSWSIGDLSDWDTSSVTDMSYMFGSAGESTTFWSIGDLGNWDTSSVTNMGNMFQHAGYSATSWSIGDLNNWDTSSVTDMGCMFDRAGYSATSWSIGDLNNWDTSSVTDMYCMFRGAGYSASSWDIGDLDNWDTSLVTDMREMFYTAGFSASTWSIGNVGRWDTSRVTTMYQMFGSAGRNDPNWSIGDIGGWDTHNVTNIGAMFYGQNNLTDIALDWDISSVTYTASMFQGCWHLKGTLRFTTTADVSQYYVSNMFLYASYYSGSKVYVSCSNDSLADAMVATRSYASSTNGVFKSAYTATASYAARLTEQVLPENVTAGTPQTITGMPDISALNAAAVANAPANTFLYGWLVDSGMATQIVPIGEFSDALTMVYSEEPEWEMTITPLYQTSQQAATEEGGSAITPEATASVTEPAAAAPSLATLPSEEPTTPAATPTPVYTITYAVNGGSLTMDAVYVYTADVPLILPTPTRDGYAFDGWYIAQDLMGEAITSTAGMTGDITLYAKWESISSAAGVTEGTTQLDNTLFAA